MNFEQWQDKYQPLLNHLDSNASFQNEAGQGIMFETYGAELEFVKSIDPKYVWTYGDEDGGYIVAGRRFVNRLGYFVCAVPHEGDEWETIELDNDDFYGPITVKRRQDDLNEDMPYALELYDTDGDCIDIEWFASEQSREQFIEVWGYIDGDEV
jgi:hypothetical protein